MMKKFFSVLVLLLMVFTLSGCWSSTQPKDLAIINSVIYDIDEENNYNVTMQIINSSAIGSTSSSGGNKLAGITVNGKGESFSDALTQTSSNLERKIFGDHNKVRFLTENFASKEYAVENLLDFIMRDALTDETSLVIVLREEDKEKIFDTTLGLSSLVGNYLFAISLTQPKLTSSSAFITTLDFIKDNYADGKQAVAGAVHLEETDNVPSLNNGVDPEDIKYKLVYDGLAVFKDYKFVGYMDAKETEIYNILAKKAIVINVEITKGNDYASANYVEPKAVVKTDFSGESATINIKLKGSYRLNKMFVENVNDENYNETIKSLEKEYNTLLIEQTKNAIAKAQEYGSDIYGFGSAMHSQNPKVWKKISADWESYFKTATINVECDLKIIRDGEINRGLLK